MSLAKVESPDPPCRGSAPHQPRPRCCFGRRLGSPKAVGWVFWFFVLLVCFFVFWVFGWFLGFFGWLPHWWAFGAVAGLESLVILYKCFAVVGFRFCMILVSRFVGFLGVWESWCRWVFSTPWWFCALAVFCVLWMCLVSCFVGFLGFLVGVLFS